MKRTISLLLIVLLINTLVVKPVHFAVIEHDYISHVDDRHSAIQHKSLSYKDCDICHFIFSLCVFQDISQFTIIADLPFILIEKFTQTLRYSTLLRYFSLRAPPYTI